MKPHAFEPCQHPGQHGYPPELPICERCRESGERTWHFAYACPSCDWQTTRLDTMADCIASHDGSAVHRLAIGTW